MFVLEKVSDFGDFTKTPALTGALNLLSGERERFPSAVRVSPDGRHIHVIQFESSGSLVSLDKHERPPPGQNRNWLELRPTLGASVVDVVYLEHGSSPVAAVVYENGKAEFWKFQECKGGWLLLQTSDLCNGLRAKVVSVCALPKLLVWCEERPPSESSPTAPVPKSNLRFCICRRAYEVEEEAVNLGTVKITLHSTPEFTVLASGEWVHFLPNQRAKPLANTSKVFLSWSLRHDTYTVNSTCRNTPIKKISARESDFKRLMSDCVGYLSALKPPEIFNYFPGSCGGLALLLSSGWICFLQKDGFLRPVYRLADSWPLQQDGSSMCIYRDILALVVAQRLTLIDLSCGRELYSLMLKTDGWLYTESSDPHTPRLLTESGLFVLASRESEGRSCAPKKSFGPSAVEVARPGTLLVEAVFEEACRYYQQRSLSSTQLTVDALKKGGRFQAPLSLASILRSYLSTCWRNAAEPSRNGWGEGVVGQDKLMKSLEGELRALVSLEELKGGLVRGGIREVEAICETLVEEEVARLLSSAELDRDGLCYLNSIFTQFPQQAWRAAQAALQLHHNGEGLLTSRAVPDVWKTVLGPVSLSDSTAPSSYIKGQPKQNHKMGNYPSCKPRVVAPLSSPALPVFELLCRSIFLFQPNWLPRFLELAQQQQGSAGLGLSLASSTWDFPGSKGGEGRENHVPLYKRVLGLLSSLSQDRNQHQDLEVELLLVSGRPNAVLQALRILMGQRQWDRVVQVAQDFCKQSPLLSKEIFTTLLCEVTQHRDLDPYLDQVWSLCPDDFTVTTILNLVLQNLPSPSPPTHMSSFYLCCSSSSPAAPFPDPQRGQLTIGLLKPLLRKVLQRETQPSQRYADILQSPTYPPPAPTRHLIDQPSTRRGPGTDTALDSHTSQCPPMGAGDVLLSTQTDILKAAAAALPADPVGSQ